MRLVLVLLAASAATVASAECGPEPRDQLHLLKYADFTCADISRAVNYYVDLGEDATLKEFQSLLQKREQVGRPDLSERIGWLCRILYEPKDKPMRPPMLGGLMLPHDQMPLDKWPLYPVAKSGSTYCVLSEGYTLAGFPEPMTKYFSYCKKSGSFRTTSVVIPSKKEAIRDINSIRSSQRWTSINWKNSGQGFSYTMNEAWTWNQIIDQAKSIPESGD
ncbi:MAG: hypothetical protein AAGG48_29570 [Planctomycetota bacterium]